MCPGHTRQEEAALRPEWGQRRPCLQGESHLLSCERPCASSLGFGFLPRSSSPLADLKLRGEEETEAGLAHLEGNAKAETKCRTESLREAQLFPLVEEPGTEVPEKGGGAHEEPLRTGFQSSLPPAS